eukprot:c21787_g1_i1 orf=702-1736(-)
MNNVHDGFPVSGNSIEDSSAPFIPILPYTTPSDLAALYEVGPELGRGQFGIIRSCTSRSFGTFFACKSISKLHISTPRKIQDVVREVRIMKRLSNPIDSQAFSMDSAKHNICTHAHAHPGNIARLHDVVEDSHFVHLIMELCRGGDLYDRIIKKKCYPEAQAAFIMKSLLETLDWCHSLGVMHRDLKPENILFVDDSDTSPIKLSDFGLALEFSSGQKFTGMAGSTFYMAPEMLQGEYSEEIDMWSAGVILFVLLSGVPPFWQATQEGIFKAIKEGEVYFPPDPWGQISLSAKDLILQMLCPEVESRLTPSQALKHPWIIHHTLKRRPQAQRLRINLGRGRLSA